MNSTTVDSTLTRQLTIARSSDGYILRPVHRGAVDPLLARAELLERMAAEGMSDEEVDVAFVGDAGLEELFDDSGAEVRSMGWEGLLVPFDKRRRVPMPSGYTMTSGVREVPIAELHALHGRSQWALESLHPDLDESMLLHHEGRLVGWVPITRISSTVSGIRLVCIHSSIHPDEERRRTYLRLAAFAQAIESQCGQGRSVLTWLPADGDPVNAYKVSVAGAAMTTHWMHARVRRDLRSDVVP